MPWNKIAGMMRRARASRKASPTTAPKMIQWPQEGERGEWSKVSRNIDEFEEFADADLLRRSLQTAMMSHQDSAPAVWKIFQWEIFVANVID